MQQLQDLVGSTHIEPTAILDIALTALLFYGLFSLIQGTRAVRLVIGAIVLYAIYVAAQAFNLRLLSGVLQTGAVVGLLALVVIFQPELRRGLERLGRVGSLSWLFDVASYPYETVAGIVARTASSLASERIGALIVIERETSLEEFSDTGVMLHADISAELLQSIFTPHTALHDGAVIIRGQKVLAAGVVLPLSDSAPSRERYGTRHRAAMGITEQTDAIAVVVSEESGHSSLVERGRVLRALDEERMRTALIALLRPSSERIAETGSRLAPARLVRGRRRKRIRAAPVERPVATSAPAADDGTRPADATAAAAAAALPGSMSRAE
jgi:diadenylate cyclase